MIPPPRPRRRGSGTGSGCGGGAWGGSHCCSSRVTTPAVWQARSAAHGGRGLFGRLQLPAYQIEPAVPEPWVGEVEARDRRELLGTAAAARAQQLDVARDERLALFEVAAIDRECEQLAVRVRVDVARRADEMRHVGPPRAVVLGDLDAVGQELLLGLRPEVAEAVDAELALRAARGVRELLEAVHGDLAEDRRDRAFDVLREQRQARRG